MYFWKFSCNSCKDKSFFKPGVYIVCICDVDVSVVVSVRLSACMSISICPSVCLFESLLYSVLVTNKRIQAYILVLFFFAVTPYAIASVFFCFFIEFNVLLLL